MSRRSLSTTIRRLREATGLTQGELARKARVTQGFISHLETGRKKGIGLVPAVRLSKALGVAVTKLIE